jgi:hypothetical protein
MKLNRYLLLLLFVITHLTTVSGQVVEKQKVIQVTGIITDEENNPVPGVSIISKKLRRGSISEITGIYNVLSLPGDTIWLTALGYKNGYIMIPSLYEEKQFTNDIVLINDTIAIKDVVILPWKTYEQFKREVLADRPVKPEITNMYLNLASIQQSIANSYNYTVSPEAGYRMAMQMNTNALYYKGQSPVNNLLNPFAWAKLFSGIKNGLFRNQKTNAKPSTKAKLRKKKS